VEFAVEGVGGGGQRMRMRGEEIWQGRTKKGEGKFEVEEMFCIDSSVLPLRIERCDSISQGI